VAKSNSLNDMMNAVDAAVKAGATVVSMSWGGSEYSGQKLWDTYFNLRSGVTFVASSGDNGENDPYTGLPAVSWPASSPYVVAVGGTSLVLDENSSIVEETAWLGSGGGISAVETRRTVPDVSYVADPETGMYVFSAFAYGRVGWWQVGGTSAGAPQWAGLFALANQGRKYPVGLKALFAIWANSKNPSLAQNNYFDIVSGTNDPDNPDAGDYAIPGYDLVTGWGSPKANFLIPYFTNYK
jgi:subtilase family serine protease